MIFEIINLITSLISMIIIGVGFLLIILFTFKSYYKKKRKRKMVEQIKEIESQLKRIGKKVWSSIWSGLSMIMTAVLCATLAIAVKPIIYKINYPLGEGYAIFASYIIAICLWVMIRPNTTTKGA